jgi:archaellum component FlaD/FlaE
MSGRLDPAKYDLGELRRVADVSDAFADDDTAPRPSSRDVVRERVYDAVAERDLTAPESARRRPYVDDPPDSLVALRATYEWLDFLLRRVGAEGAREALAYYERIGWLSPAAEDHLSEHLAALNPPVTRSGSVSDLGADDHRLSFDYVTKLSAVAARGRDGSEYRR